MSLVPSRGRARPGEHASTAPVVVGGAVILVLASALAIGSVSEIDEQLKVAIALLFVGALIVSAGNPGRVVVLVAIGCAVSVTVKVPILDATVNSTELIAVFGLVLLAPHASFRSIPGWWFTSAAVVLAGATVAVVASAPDEWTSWWFIARLAFGLGLAATIGGNRSLARPVMRGLAVASVIVVGGVLLQRAGSFAVVGAPYLSDRYDSFFGYYTVAAGFLALVLPLCWVLLATSVGHRADWIAGAVGFGACGLGLVLLQSRGGLAAGGAALCVAIALSPGGKRQVFLVAALCVSLFAVVWLFTDQSSRSYVLDRLTDSGDINAGSDSQRADLQRVGAQLASERPLGIGYGQFSSNVNSSVTRVLFHSHSVYSQVPLDIGWLGASALAVLVIVPIWKAVVARIRRRQTYLLAGCAGALVGALVQGANDYLFYEAAWWMGLALVLGLAVAALPATDEIPAVIERART